MLALLVVLTLVWFFVVVGVGLYLHSRPDPCAEGCRYAKDVGVWPEHRCVVPCIYRAEGRR